MPAFTGLFYGRMNEASAVPTTFNAWLKLQRTAPMAVVQFPRDRLSGRRAAGFCKGGTCCGSISMPGPNRYTPPLPIPPNDAARRRRQGYPIRGGSLQIETDLLLGNTLG
jgi:hypothetical protein